MRNHYLITAMFILLSFIINDSVGKGIVKSKIYKFCADCLFEGHFIFILKSPYDIGYNTAKDYAKVAMNEKLMRTCYLTEFNLDECGKNPIYYSDISKLEKWEMEFVMSRNPAQMYYVALSAPCKLFQENRKSNNDESTKSEKIKIKRKIKKLFN